MLKTRKSKVTKNLFNKIQASFKDRLKEASKNISAIVSTQLQNPPVNSKQNMIVVYLLFPNYFGKRDVVSNVNELFQTRLAHIDEFVTEQPIFMDQHHAFWYSRFISGNCMILKAYVNENAVYGNHGELQLKKGFLLKEYIHGCYTSRDKSAQFIENPGFNKELLN